MPQDLQTVVFQRRISLSGNEPLQGPVKREGGKVYYNIVDDSWVYTGPPPPPLPPPPSTPPSAPPPYPFPPPPPPPSNDNDCP
eukprot:1356986-Pyramimonas_sp.AAC.1